MATKKRFIEAYSLMEAFRRYMVENYDRERCASEENCKLCERGCLWRKVLTVAPTVDAVEVVRCKDCKHHDIFNDLPYCNHTRGLAGSVSQDGYCYLGERKDNGSK